MSQERTVTIYRDDSTVQVALPIKYSFCYPLLHHFWTLWADCRLYGQKYFMVGLWAKPVQVEYKRVKAVFWTAGNTVLVISRYIEGSDADHYYIHWPRERFCWFKDVPSVCAGGNKL